MLADAEDGKPDVLLLATGSEVSLCVTAYETLKSEGIKAGSSVCRPGNCSRIRVKSTATTFYRPEYRHGSG